jgi:hypothetical protein
VVLTLTDGRLGEGNYITQSLLIIVEDVNDNAPIFKPYQPSISVREDSPPRVLAELEATDLDEGPYGQVRDIEIHKIKMKILTTMTILRLSIRWENMTERTDYSQCQL